MNIFKKDTSGAKKEKLSATAVSALVIAVVVVVNAILFTVVEAFGLYLYSTEKTDLSISGMTDSLFAAAIEDGKKVKISFCSSEDQVKLNSVGSFVYQTAKNFEARYPELIELDYINITTQRNSKGELIEDFSKYQKDMNGNDTRIYTSTVIFECGENYRVVTDNYSTAGYADFFTLDSAGSVTSYNGEEVIAGMINWVLADEHKTAYFTQYHGEIVDLSLTNLFAIAGYYIDVIDLRKNEIPEDADLLVISNPTADFQQGAEGSGVRSEIERIETYLEKGGDLLVFLDPYVKTLPVLESFIAERGISFASTVNDNGTRLRNIVKDDTNAITTDGFTIVAEYANTEKAQNIKNTVESYSDGRVIVRQVSALELSAEAQPLLVSSSSSATYAGGNTIDTNGKYCIAAISEKETEGGASSVMVVPSVYLAVSDSLVARGYSNKDFVFSVFESVYGVENIPYGCKAVLMDTTTLENLTMGTAKLYTALLMCIPAAFGIVGTIIIVRRKNR